MNDTQWVFELESMNLEDEEKLKQAGELTELIREGIAAMLGLNLMPVEDEKTKLLRRPTPDEYIPLALAIGRDEFIEMVMSKRDEFATQERERMKLEYEMAHPDYVKIPGEQEFVEMTPEELDEFMQSSSDVEFENTPEEVRQLLSWGSTETQLYLENLVLNKDDIEEGSIEPQPARTIGQARRDLIREVQQEQQGSTRVVPIRIESDSILGEIPQKPQRSSITVDTEE